MNKQRESVYTLRREDLEGQIHIAEDEVTDSRGYLMATAEELLDSRMDQFANAEMDASEWDMACARAVAGVHVRRAGLPGHRFRRAQRQRAARRVVGAHSRRCAEKEQIAPRDILAQVERNVMLQIVDQQWKDHLLPRPPQGRHRPARLRPARSAGRAPEGELPAVPGHARADRRISSATCGCFARSSRPTAKVTRGPCARAGATAPAGAHLQRPESSSVFAPGRARAAAAAAAGRLRRQRASAGARRRRRRATQTVKRDEPKIGRNDPCWCGSGKKYTNAMGPRDR